MSTQHKTLWAKMYEAIKHQPAPYYYNYSVWTIIKKPIRKKINVVIIPNIPFNNLRIALYRLIGFKIGKNVFIGMKCYLDDMCYDLVTIEDNVTISYGVYMACHGVHQTHNPIIIKEHAYIGMRASIISPVESGVTIGRNAIVGACSLVNKNVPDGATAVGIPCKIIHTDNPSCK